MVTYEFTYHAMERFAERVLGLTDAAHAVRCPGCRDCGLEGDWVRAELELAIGTCWDATDHPDFRALAACWRREDASSLVLVSDRVVFCCVAYLDGVRIVTCMTLKSHLRMTRLMRSRQKQTRWYRLGLAHA